MNTDNRIRAVPEQESQAFNSHAQFRNKKIPMLATDIIIEYCDKKSNVEGIILIERGEKPYGIALPGGHAEYGLTLEENAVKEAKEETNLDVILHNGHGKLLGNYSRPDRDPRTHMVAAVYIGRGYGTISAGDDAKKAMLVPYSQLENMVNHTPEVFAFDHANILKDYLSARR